jgi:iron-sulfur cluster assembly protein
MIVVTDAAAKKLKEHLVDGKAIRMFLTSIDPTGANYGLRIGDPADGDVVFDSNGLEIRMSPEDAEILGVTIIDYIDNKMGRGFLIHGPHQGESCFGCSGCSGHDMTCGDHECAEHEECSHNSS